MKVIILIITSSALLKFRYQLMAIDVCENRLINDDLRVASATSRARVRVKYFALAYIRSVAHRRGVKLLPPVRIIAY